MPLLICRVFLVVAVAAGLSACGDSSPMAPPVVMPPVMDAACAGVRGPVRAWVLGGGTALLPPTTNSVLVDLAAALETDYLGVWSATFLSRTGRDLDALAAEAADFLAREPAGEVVLVGHSSGGADACAIAARLPGLAPRLWLVTLDPVEDTIAIGEPVDVRTSPVGAGRHYHVTQPNPGPVIPGSDLQLGIKIDYLSGTVRRKDLDVDHGAVDNAAIPCVRADLEESFGACLR